MSQYRLGFLTEIDCASYTLLHAEMSPAIGACKHTENDRSQHKLHKSANARLLSHGWYRQNCGPAASGRPPAGKLCIPSMFSATLALGERLAGQARSASAGFLVRTGAGNAHGAK